MAFASITVSMADAAHFVEADYVGIVSANYLEADTLINLLQEHGNAAVYIDLEQGNSY